MQPTRMELSQRIRYFFSILSTQIKINSKNGATDLAKSMENSLLSIINATFNKNFVNMNNGKSNYPAIDYGDSKSNVALQMTASNLKTKFKNTLEVFKSNSNLYLSFREIWIFVLVVDDIAKTKKIFDDVVLVKYFTFNDVINSIENMSIVEQNKIINLFEVEFSNYLLPSFSYMIDINNPISNNLESFNIFINTSEWYEGNLDGGYDYVRSKLEDFRRALSVCSNYARIILGRIIELAKPPQDLDEKIEVNARDLIGALNISYENNFDEFKFHFEFLEKNNLVVICENYLGSYVSGYDVIFESEKILNLNYKLYEPNINLYSSLYLFYLENFTVEDFYKAIVNVDFSQIYG
ncbi:hypothetical protein CAT36_00305 [Acinetobacter pittii]|uniref:SMEK domain-containing protein n=1 Tax=Acinetobacter pittii TaxID=48296 RepID=UPI000A39E034|nr:SMEK domain-containing protein [Acinetobacter pittii]OTU54442.1 hypothetical protein CAT36_00305 [Acinetobacter pittii]